jgi:hypothetical protein
MTPDGIAIADAAGDVVADGLTPAGVFAFAQEVTA